MANDHADVITTSTSVTDGVSAAAGAKLFTDFAASAKRFDAPAAPAPKVPESPLPPAADSAKAEGKDPTVMPPLTPIYGGKDLPKDLKPSPEELDKLRASKTDSPIVVGKISPADAPPATPPGDTKNPPPDAALNQPPADIKLPPPVSPDAPAQPNTLYKNADQPIKGQGLTEVPDGVQIIKLPAGGYTPTFGPSSGNGNLGNGNTWKTPRYGTN